MTNELFMNKWNKFNEILKNDINRLKCQRKSVKTYIN